jgi:diguanylate cyclase (GGDEF)-like protein
MPGGRRDAALRRFPINLKFAHSLGFIRRGPTVGRGFALPSGATVAKKKPAADCGHVDGLEACLVEQPGHRIAAAGSASTLDPVEIFASIREVPYEWRIDSDVLIWGANVGGVLGLSDPAVLGGGRAYARLVDPQDGQSRVDAIMHSAGQDEGAGVPYQVEYALRPPEVPSAGSPGDDLWLEDTGRWFAGPDGKPVRAHGVVRIINERHEREARLAYLSRFDPLTGEMNHWRTTEVLGAIIAEAVKLRSSCGFLLAAIDNLNRINDAYGFDVADEVIVAVGKRMRAQLRGKDHLGRMGGNKFGIILNDCTPKDMLIAADRLLVAVRDEVVPTKAGPVAVTATIGGVTAPRHARNLHEVLARAQDALYGAKAKRRGSFHAYRPNPEREAQRRDTVRATEDIITALNERRIFLAYEPVVAITTREPAFYECLMRVKRADGSLLVLNDVVPLAERLGLVRLLDHRVLELVLQELIAAPGLNASLNVSAASTTDPDWWTVLGAMLRAHQGVAERLTVEITETTAIQDIDETRGFVTRVKDLGCRIAIDDFGAGYTSFRNLRELGVDIVKIDGSFVQNLKRSDDDCAFVQTLIDLARRLRLTTVAEWVPDEETAEMLAAWGCDHLQGALVGLASSDRPWASAPSAAAASG